MVAEPTIAFSAADYDALIASIRDLINDLGAYDQRAAGTPFAPEGDWLLQPDGQVWAPPADLVEAGKTFGNVLGAHSAGLLSQLEAFFDGLCSARAIFAQVSDLAAYDAASFSSEYPQLQPGGGLIGGSP